MERDTVLRRQRATKMIKMNPMYQSFAYLKFGFATVLCHVTNSQDKWAVGFFEDFVKVELDRRFLHLEISCQMATHLLQLGAKETHETDAQLDQLKMAVHHKMPGKSAAKCRRANIVLVHASRCRHGRRCRFERAQIQRLALLNFRQVRRSLKWARRLIIHHRGGDGGRVVEANQRSRLGEENLLFIFDD